jgi:very-short-patch-repair endonuclease
VPLAQQLRKEMTPEEKHLWYDFLNKLPLTVNRQKNIGNFIVDFYIASKNIVIEIDGRQHEMPEESEKDQKRDFELSKLGIRVLRYTNKSINKNFSDVCDDILTHLGLTWQDVRRDR